MSWWDWFSSNLQDLNSGRNCAPLPPNFGGEQIRKSPRIGGFRGQGLHSGVEGMAPPYPPTLGGATQKVPQNWGI
ncbi:UNVERIFIED_CONTAM: hypothetical protein BEN50_05320 [Euhalothece sp. KZN 001]